jgi:hypothetical protein
MNVYTPPVDDLALESEIDFRDAVPGLAVKLGGFSLGGAGFMVAGAGLQLLTFFDLSWMLLSVSAVLLTLGCVSVLLAPFVIKGRSWAAMLSVPVAVVMALAAVVWGVASTMMLFISPLSLLGAVTSVVAAMAAPFAVPGSMRATRARNALYSA